MSESTFAGIFRSECRGWLWILLPVIAPVRRMPVSQRLWTLMPSGHRYTISTGQVPIYTKQTHTVMYTDYSSPALQSQIPIVCIGGVILKHLNGWALFQGDGTWSNFPSWCDIRAAFVVLSTQFDSTASYDSIIQHLLLPIDHHLHCSCRSRLPFPQLYVRKQEVAVCGLVVCKGWYVLTIAHSLRKWISEYAGKWYLSELVMANQFPFDCISCFTMGRAWQPCPFLWTWRDWLVTLRIGTLTLWTWVYCGKLTALFPLSPDPEKLVKQGYWGFPENCVLADWCDRCWSPAPQACCDP